MTSSRSISELVAELGLPPNQVKLVFVNGRISRQEYVLQDGDRVGIFPPVGGG